MPAILSAQFSVTITPDSLEVRAASSAVIDPTRLAPVLADVARRHPSARPSSATNIWSERNSDTSAWLRHGTMASLGFEAPASQQTLLQVKADVEAALKRAGFTIE